MNGRRLTAYAAGVFTLTVFLFPPLLAPGPLTASHGAAAVFAALIALGVWRHSMRADPAATLPHRVAPVSAGLLAAAAAIFIAVLAAAWAPAAPGAWWWFPFSPVGMFAVAAPGLEPVSETAAAGVAAALTVALIAGGFVGAIALIGPIRGRETLRVHTLVWRGERPEMAAARDALDQFRHPPVSARLWLRSLSFLVAFCCLLYAPVFARLLGAARIPGLDRAFSSPEVSSVFAALWLTGLWGAGVAAAMIFCAAYLRLGFTLVR
ncbi:MAG: hypothetical protein WD969_09400 [Paracoccaceae bacterium]